jgi:hypothetical protein
LLYYALESIQIWLDLLQIFKNTAQLSVMMRTIFSLKKAQRYTAAVVPAHRFVSGINSASAKFEDEVTGILRGVIEPATNRSIDSLGILQVT